MSSFGENKPGNRVIVSCYCEFYGLFYCLAQLVLVFAIDRPLHPHTHVRRLEAYLKKQIPENFTSRKNINTLFAGPPGRIQIKKYPR